MIVKLNLLEKATFIDIPENSQIAAIKYIDGENIEITFYGETEDAS